MTVVEQLREEERDKIAVKLLALDIEIDKIAEATGLSREKILQLKENK